ncbi:MAG: guanylate kinase [Lachnospiraceae bacterium]|jgi:guanylate kinase|nr:guanylate kinase [Lachnospiraceae bacterium]MCI9590748.1 guanylate kinase [Lachnospiraceae bacterium]
MGKIFYLMGKSASGKDTLFKEILERIPELKTVVPYTTRPIRTGEKDGREYFFTTEENLQRLLKAGKVIECRTYQTMMGAWNYFTVDDGQIDIEKENYLVIGTLESYEKTRQYFGKEYMVPFYITVENGLRLQRAIDREKNQTEPHYDEVCRRYLADEKDFCDNRLKECEIEKFYENQDFQACLNTIVEEIRGITINNLSKRENL